MKPPITTDLQEAVRIITAGRIVAFPTGTSYGLAVDALQGHALQRLRNLKHRPDEKSFTVFARPELVDTFFRLNKEEQAFLQKYAGQPFTVLLQPAKALEHLTQEGRVGLRLIDHPLMQQLAEAVQVPLTATSANISGRQPCADVVCIQDQFPYLLDPNDVAIKRAGPTTYDLSLGCILDGGTLPVGQQSTIVRYAKGNWQTIRQGAGAL
ncbi:MAG: L-threonylcarbamoyladenylate synthase [Candidatus Andersenbacteria bacterium]